jgi:hypothetical protein
MRPQAMSAFSLGAANPVQTRHVTHVTIVVFSND